MADFDVKVKVDPAQAVANLDKVKRKLSATEQTADSVGRALKRALGFFGGAYLGVTVVRTLANFSQEMSTVKAITQATAEQFKILRDAAKDLGATTRFSATQAAQGEIELAKAGLLVSEVISTLPNTLHLAQAANIDLASSSGIVVNALRTFGIEATKSAHIVDVLGKASISANTTVPAIAEALKYVGATAAGLNVPIEEVTAAIAAMANKGIDASSAGTALNAIIKAIAKPTKAFSEEMKAAGLTTDDLSIAQHGLTNVLAKVTASGLSMEEAIQGMDVRAARAFGTLKTSIPFVEQLTEALVQSDGTIKKMASTMDDNLNGALLAVKSSLEAVVIAFGDLGAESSLTVGMRGLATVLRTVASNLGTLISLLTIGAAAWGAYFAAIKVQNLLTAAAAATTYAKAVLSGNAVVLGSAAAEAQKAAATVASRQAEVNATKAALLRLEAETSKAIVLQGSTTAEFARIAILKQTAALEAQLATQTEALTAARIAGNAANAKAAGPLSKLSSIFPGLTAGVKAFTTAIAANPIGAIAVALTIVIGLMITFRNQIGLGGQYVATFGDLLAVTWQKVKEDFQTLIWLFQEGFAYIANAFPIIAPLVDAFKAAFGDIELSLSGLLVFFARSIDASIGLFLGLTFAIIEAFAKLPAALKNIMLLAMNGIIDITEKGINKVVTAINSILSAVHLEEILPVTLTKYENDAAGAGAALGNAVGDAFKFGLEYSGAQDVVSSLLAEADKRAIARSKSNKETASTTAAVTTATNGLNEALKGHNVELSTILQKLKTEATLLKLAASERAIQNSVLKIEDDIKRKLTTTEKELVEQQLRINQGLKVQADLYDQIRGPVEQYKVTLAGLNELLKEGKISQQEMTAALQQTALGAGLQGVKTSVLPEETDTAALEALQEQYSQRQIIVEQARMAELLTQQEYNDLSLQLAQKYNDDVQRIEQARFQTQLAAGKTAFGALTGLAKTYAGEQSQTYRALFAISKGFAIAETTVAIAQGIANAIKLGWPAMIPAVAAVVAQSAGLIGQIQSANYSGAYQNGGSFTVGGSGGPDSQMVAFRASPNETVSVRTPGQERAAQAAAQPQTQTQPIQIVNVDDPGKLEDFMATPAGTKSVLNIIKKNPSVIKQFVQG